MVIFHVLLPTRVASDIRLMYKTLTKKKQTKKKTKCKIQKTPNQKNKKPKQQKNVSLFLFSVGFDEKDNRSVF